MFPGSMLRNMDLSMLAPRIELPNISPPTPPPPQAPVTPSKGVHINLENNELWKKFHALNTEMIITKTGRWEEFTFLNISKYTILYFKAYPLAGSKVW